MQPNAGNDPEAQVRILAGLTSTDWRTRQDAVESILAVNDLTLAKAVISIVRENPGSLSAISAALEILEKMGRSLTNELVEMLSDQDRDLRLFAALILGELRDQAVVPALLKLATDKDEDENARLNAIEALGKLTAIEAVEPIRNVLREGSPFLQYGAISALGDIGDPVAVEDIQPFLGDAYLSEPAVVALGLIGDVAVVPDIVRWANRHAENGVCEHTDVAAHAIALIFKRAPVEEKVKDTFVEEAGADVRNCLIECSDQGDRPVDYALLLGWLADAFQDDARFGPALVKLLSKQDARKEAESALLRNPMSALQELSAALDSPVSEQACAAARILGEVGGDQVVSSLLRALESENESLASTAAESLGKSGSQNAVEPLVNQLGNPSGQVRKAVIGALAVLSPDAVRGDLANTLLNHPNPFVRESMISLLTLVDEKRGAAAALFALSDEDLSVRKTAVELLPRFKDPQILSALSQALDDPNDGIRMAAARACASLPPPQSLPLLQRAAKDRNSWVRMHAVRALALVVTRDNYAFLLPFLEDPSPPVRIAAIEGLGRLPGDLAVDSLERYLEDKNTDVKKAARLALDQKPKGAA